MKKIVFRLDDVQGYYLRNTQLAIIDSFLKNEKGALSLTLGVIGKGFTEDEYLVREIQDRKKQVGNQLEIASHTWSHEPLILKSFEEQLEDLNMFNKNIQPLFPYDKIRTLIAPQNFFNDNTFAAMRLLGYDILSSICTDDFYFQDAELELRPAQIPAGALTSLFPNPKIRNIDEVFEEILIQLKRNNQQWATVVLHPQEFSVNAEVDWFAISELNKLIGFCLKDDFEFVTFVNLLDQQNIG